jgi:hypothetical protein
VCKDNFSNLKINTKVIVFLSFFQSFSEKGIIGNRLNKKPPEIGWFCFKKYKPFYKDGGYKILELARLTPFKFEPYFALIASRNLFAISA